MRTTTACGVGLLAAAALALASGTARANDYSYPYFKDVYNKGIYGYGGPDTYDLIIGSLYGVPGGYDVKVYGKAEASYVYACKKPYSSYYYPKPYVIYNKEISNQGNVYPKDYYYYFDVKLYPPMYCDYGYSPTLACIKFWDKKVYFPYNYKYIWAYAQPSYAKKIFQLGYYYPFNYKCKEILGYSHEDKSKDKDKSK